LESRHRRTNFFAVVFFVLSPKKSIPVFFYFFLFLLFFVDEKSIPVTGCSGETGYGLYSKQNIFFAENHPSFPVNIELLFLCSETSETGETGETGYGLYSKQNIFCFSEKKT